MTENNFAHLTQNISHHMVELGKYIPKIMHGFSSLARSVGKDGALDKKTKELVALSLGIAVHCKWMHRVSQQGLVSLGATRQEVAEALGMSFIWGVTRHGCLLLEPCRLIRLI